MRVALEILDTTKCKHIYALLCLISPRTNLLFSYHGNSVAFENPTDANMWYEAGLAKYHGIGRPFEKEDWE
jgi:hypothetical protein